MGKSTTCECFRAVGIPIFDADRSVHSLYASAEVAAAIAIPFPEAIRTGRVDRAVLAELVLGNRGKLSLLEKIVHPLVSKDRQKFYELALQSGSSIVLLDVPLLFETMPNTDINLIVVITADKKIQQKRVMARQGMTQKRFSGIVSRQMPDYQKQKKAHSIIHTDHGYSLARKQVQTLMSAIRSFHKFGK